LGKLIFGSEDIDVDVTGGPLAHEGVVTKIEAFAFDGAADITGDSQAVAGNIEFGVEGDNCRVDGNDSETLLHAGKSK